MDLENHKKLSYTFHVNDYVLSRKFVNVYQAKEHLLGLNSLKRVNYNIKQ